MKTRAFFSLAAIVLVVDVVVAAFQGDWAAVGARAACGACLPALYRIATDPRTR